MAVLSQDILKMKEKQYKIQKAPSPLTVEEDTLASFDGYFWFFILLILSPLNFFVQECMFVDNLLCISSMNARHDWQNLVFVPDNCCLLLTAFDIFRFTACHYVVATGHCETAAVPFWINTWCICGSYWLFFKLLWAQGVMGKLNIVVLLDNWSQLSLTPFSKNAARPANLWSVWLRAGTKTRGHLEALDNYSVVAMCWLTQNQSDIIIYRRYCEVL